MIDVAVGMAVGIFVSVLSSLSVHFWRIGKPSARFTSLCVAGAAVILVFGVLALSE